MSSRWVTWACAWQTQLAPIVAESDMSDAASVQTRAKAVHVTCHAVHTDRYQNHEALEACVYAGRLKAT